MHIGLGDADREILDMDDDHVRVRCADVVLDHKPSVRPRGGCGQARMVEFQLRGAIDAGHEGRDQRPISVSNIIGGGAVHALLGQRRLHRVELLVQIHHKAMQAVRLAMPCLRHRGNGAGIDEIVRRCGKCAQQSL